MRLRHGPNLHVVLSRTYSRRLRHLFPVSWLQAATRSGLHPNSATVAGLGYLLIAPAGIRLPRCDDAVWSVEMPRIVHCVWLIPCDYGVRFVCNPTCHLGGGFS